MEQLGGTSVEIIYLFLLSETLSLPVPQMIVTSLGTQVVPRPSSSSDIIVSLMCCGGENTDEPRSLSLGLVPA